MGKRQPSKGTELAAPRTNPLAMLGDLSPEQVELIKQTVAKGTTNEELALFLYTAKSTGLDPLRKQIHAVKRFDRKANREVMTIQTGIDGYRVMAERTGRYVPGREPTFAINPNDESRPESATAYVKKLVNGEWHEVSATARWAEYKQEFFDRDTKTWKISAFWARMPFGQLAKCAEALALRRAFPDTMGGVYTHEEMQQADSTPALPAPDPELSGFLDNLSGGKAEAPKAAAAVPAARQVARVNEETGEVEEEPVPEAPPAPAAKPAVAPARKAKAAPADALGF